MRSITAREKTVQQQNPQHTGLGLLEVAAGISAAASLTSAITSGVGTYFTYDLQKEALQQQKKIDNFQAMMDLQAHQVAMEQANLALDATAKQMERSERLAAAQEGATLAAIEQQEKATKRGDYGEASQALNVQQQAAHSGIFDIFGTTRSEQKATVARAKWGGTWMPWALAGIGIYLVLFK